MQQEKETTIYDLALKLDISPATVSRGLKDHPAISKKTKKKILELALEMGYRSNNFARNLREQRTYTIGAIVPRLNSHFMASVIAGVESIANKEGFNLIISQSSENIKKEMENAGTMFNNRVEGLLVSSVDFAASIENFTSFLRKNIPVIFFDRVVDMKGFTNILIDNRKAGYDATTHLIKQGCKRIVHVTGIQKTNVYLDRLQGYKQALAENKLPFKKDHVIFANFSQEAGISAAEEIMRMKRLPDGAFVANDNCAVSCMVTLKKAGFRIPEDIAFVGFNNDPVSVVVEPNLTTIDYRGHEMGEVVARNLVNHLNGTHSMQATNTIILNSELIIRGSSLRVIKARPL
jgi:LacI family transcriptional regulator